jgi:hypothetical protein
LLAIKINVIFYYKTNHYFIKIKHSMALSRIERFKEYRNSLIKEDSTSIQKPVTANKNVEVDTYETTSTLPMDEVIESLKEDTRAEDFLKSEKKRKIYLIIIWSAVAVVLVAAIILFAILVWR